MARDGTKTRERIRREALRLFVEQGVDGTTTRDIAEACAMSEGNLYRHFEGKEDLAWILFRDNYAALAGELEQAIGEGGDAATTLRRIVALLCRLFDEEPFRFRYLLLSQHNHLNRVSDDTAGPFAVLRAYFEARIAAKEVAVGPATLATALSIAPVIQVATALVYGELPGPLSRWCDPITDATLRGLSL
ncbi:MAG: TetR/AcrR family transcriptional regulator [Rhodospirillaceae bacterium]|nr:TetR/AcrR family transcriptional regulator [Rhodospirillaceae bacterium]MBT6118136.1 TetR/AcrR family transcriptional regulator [Rhodospirillaceae bacterium]